MKNESLFVDPLHVKKHVCTNSIKKGFRILLYERAVNAPSRERVNALKAAFSQKRKAYLGGVIDSEVYRACPNLQDLVTKVTRSIKPNVCGPKE